MLIAKVTGSLVATQKVGSMVGHKLMLVEPYRLDPKDRGSAGDAPAARWWRSIRSAPARARWC